MLARAERRGYVFVDDPACDRYDWLVVFDEMPDEDRGTFRKGCEELKCPREHTILCTWEPTSVKNYSKAYTRQFAHYLSNRPPEAEKHPHYHLGRGYYPWFYGRLYDETAGMAPPEKTLGISAICSAKVMKRTQHYARFKLLEGLKARVPGLEWWGHGVRDFDWKYKLLDPYKYHVAVENHIAPYHWSEKLADSILGGCLTFYAGDPDIAETLPEGAIIPIPIDDPVRAAEIINTAMANGEYEKRRGAIAEARRLILEKYNLWDQLIEVIEGAAATTAAEASGGGRPARIYSRKALRRHHPLTMLADAFGHVRLWLGHYRRHSPVVRELIVNPKAALKLFCVYFDARPVWRSDCVEPLQAGRARTGVDLGMPADDTGENISAENVRYGEMTAWYWVWKNYLPRHPELKYVGFCHYRRFLDFAGMSRRGDVRTTYRGFLGIFERCYHERLLLEKIGGADIAVRRASDCGCGSLRGQIAAWRGELLGDFDRMVTLVKEREPGRETEIDAAVGSPVFAMELQVVMTRKYFPAFMEWAFGLCREFERRWPWSGPSEGPDARTPALLIERLFAVWLALRKAEGARVIELPLVKLTARNFGYYALRPLVGLMSPAVRRKFRNRYK